MILGCLEEKPKNLMGQLSPPPSIPSPMMVGTRVMELQQQQQQLSFGQRVGKIEYERGIVAGRGAWLTVLQNHPSFEYFNVPSENLDVGKNITC